MKKKTLVMFNVNETRKDPRVRRTAKTLGNMGYRVIVISPKLEIKEEYEIYGNFEIVRIDLPQSYDEQDMAEFKFVCLKAYQLLNSCDSEIINISLKLDNILLGSRKYFNIINRITNSISYRVSKCLTENKKIAQYQRIASLRSTMIINLNLYREAVKYSPDVVYCNDLDTLLSGYMLKINYSAYLVFDSHEVYPEQLPVHARSETWYNFYSNLEKELITKTDVNLTVCDSIGGYYEQKYGAKFITIRNCSSRKLLPPESILKRKNKPRNILYHGVYLPYRGLEEVILSAKHVENAQFVFRGLGSYEKTLKDLVYKQKLETKITFAKPVEVDQLIPLASECDIGLNPFISVCLNTEFALPNKFFEYMMAGLALINADLVEMRNMTKQHNLGMLYNSQNVKDLSDTLNEMLANPDQLDMYRSNAFHAAKSEFHWEKEQQKFIDCFSGLSIN